MCRRLGAATSSFCRSALRTSCRARRLTARGPARSRMWTLIQTPTTTSPGPSCGCSPDNQMLDVPGARAPMSAPPSAIGACRLALVEQGRIIAREVGREMIAAWLDRRRRSRELVDDECDRGFWDLVLAERRWRDCGDLATFLDAVDSGTRVATIDDELVRISNAEYYRFRAWMLARITEE